MRTRRAVSVRGHAKSSKEWYFWIVYWRNSIPHSRRRSVIQKDRF